MLLLPTGVQDQQRQIGTEVHTLLLSRLTFGVRRAANKLPLSGTPRAHSTVLVRLSGPRNRRVGRRISSWRLRRLLTISSESQHWCHSGVLKVSVNGPVKCAVDRKFTAGRSPVRR